MPVHRFLTARWEDLVLLNYDCPARLLERYVPAGTELDPWRGSHVVSLVGFRFVDTRVLGLAVPGHGTFEEVNLRFYVRRVSEDASARRGVVFIRELVPLPAVAAVARIAYGEPYRAVGMGHRVDLDPDHGGSAEYRWVHHGARHRIVASVRGEAKEVADGSEAHFITERYWGYGRRRRGSQTLEYRVDHPRWRVWTDVTARCESDAESTLYGAFGEVLAGRPRSAFASPGGPVVVHRHGRVAQGPLVHDAERAGG